MPPEELSFTQRMLIGGMALLTLVRWGLGAALEISPGEALLAEWGRHPAPVGLHGGFGTAAFSWLSTLAGGWTPLAVRFFAPLLAVAASAVLYRMLRSLTGEKAAAWSVALLNLTPLWNYSAIFLDARMPGMLFLLCGMAAVWRALRRASAWDWHWPLAGVLFGAGFLCWYGTLWGPVCAILLMASSRRWRRRLLRPGPWWMLVNVGLFIWPVWQWNHAHAMAGWYYWLEQIRPVQGTGLAAPLVMLGKWALALTPLVFLAMGWALVMGVKRWPRSDTGRFLTAFALPPLVGALILSLAGGGEASWLAPALPALCGLLPWAWEQILTEKLPWKQRFQWLTILPALILTPLCLDSQILRHVGIPFPLRSDPSVEWRGWRSTTGELTRIIQEAASKAGEDAQGGKRLFLIARDERLASILNFYFPQDLPVRWPTPAHPLVYVAESAIIENAYHTWPRYDSVSSGRSHFVDCTALYITDDLSADDPPLNITRAFRSFRPAALFDVVSAGETVRRIRVFACFDYSGIPR